MKLNAVEELLPGYGAPSLVTLQLYVHGPLLSAADWLCAEPVKLRSCPSLGRDAAASTEEVGAAGVIVAVGFTA